MKRGSEWHQFRRFWCSGRLPLKKWIFQWFFGRKGQLWVRPKPRGGAAFTQKSERLSDQIQKTSFQIWDLTFCSPRAALLALERLFCSGEEVGVFRVNPVFLMPHWPMDMAALMGRSCTSDQAKKHMFFRSYTAFVSFV